MVYGRSIKLVNGLKQQTHADNSLWGRTFWGITKLGSSVGQTGWFSF